MNRIEFAKLQCGGNDFILIDLGRGDPSLPLPDLSKRMCKRRISVGADGLLAVGRDKESDFSLFYFNQDGSEARFCGNGILCAAQWVYENGGRKSPIRFWWQGSKYEVWVAEGGAKTELPRPQDLKLDLRLQSGRIIGYVVIGVPHAVTFETEVERIDVNESGREIRSDPILSPQGANVDFCQVVDRGRIRLRTYERGVESETMSCGTGAAAASYIGHHSGIVDRKVKVSAPGGEATVHIDCERLFLEGKPTMVYEGVLEKP